MSLRPTTRAEARRKSYKVAVDAEEARWRREDVLVEIRKSKREENLTKKRCEAGPHHLGPPPTDACGMKVLALAALSFVHLLYYCFALDDHTLSTMLSRSWFDLYWTPRSSFWVVLNFSVCCFCLCTGPLKHRGCPYISDFLYRWNLVVGECWGLPYAVEGTKLGYILH